jgi:hypothetical protein
MLWATDLASAVVTEAEVYVTAKSRNTLAVPAFVPAIELNRGLYADVVAPILRPWRHSAALIGWGSQVLGYDTERSTDHGWGPRLTILLDDGDVDAARAAIDASLPQTYAGWPVVYGWDATPAQHHVRATTLEQWTIARLGFAADPITAIDWLATPQQLLLEVVRGAVYHDGLGTLVALRERLAYFPDDVWRWMLACQWQRVGQEEAFAGRTAEVDDDTGSRILAARMARNLMQLWFLYARTYWPYTKWFGFAFAQLPGAGELRRHLDGAIGAPDFATRERALVAAYELVACRHNDAGVSEPIATTARDYFGRPYRVIGADRFVAACRASVTDEQLCRLPLVGSIDQLCDSTDVLSAPLVARRLRAIYQA